MSNSNGLSSRMGLLVFTTPWTAPSNLRPCTTKENYGPSTEPSPSTSWQPLPEPSFQNSASSLGLALTNTYLVWMSDTENQPLESGWMEHGVRSVFACQDDREAQARPREGVLAKKTMEALEKRFVLRSNRLNHLHRFGRDNDLPSATMSFQTHESIRNAIELATAILGVTARVSALHYHHLLRLRPPRTSP